MSLDAIIPPEIVDCKLAHALTRLAARPDIHIIIEIGSSSGDGSTAAIVKGMDGNPSKPMLHCFEMSAMRFGKLCDRYLERRDVMCWAGCTVGPADFLSEEQVENFYQFNHTNLNKYALETVLAWLKQDLDYLQQDIPVDSLNHFLMHRITDLNSLMVFIDGSAFTAQSELELVHDARIVVLDDTNDCKNFHNYHRLKNDPIYRLIEEDQNLRNGYAVFERQL